MSLVEQVIKNGVSAKTNFNDAEGQQQVIEQLWGEWFSKGNPSANVYCLYHEYGQDGSYSVTIGVADEDTPQIPEGKFETFRAVVKEGDMQALTDAVCEYWETINSAGLERAFTCDVERYTRTEDEIEVTIFTALK